MLIFSVGFFTWLALRKAVINDDRIARGEPPLEKLEDEKVLVWPDLVYTELICMVICTVILVVWAIAAEGAARAAGHQRQGAQPVEGAVVLPRPAGDARLLRPVDGRRRAADLDHRRPDRHALHRLQPEGQRLLHLHASGSSRSSTFLFGFVVLWVVLIVLGTFLRGPNWNFFGPFELLGPAQGRAAEQRQPVGLSSG